MIISPLRLRPASPLGLHYKSFLQRGFICFAQLLDQ